MHDPATTEWMALRQRWRQHLQRVRELMDEHCRVAMTATGGKVRPAARILHERMAADTELQHEMDMLEDLQVQLGFQPPPVRRPSANPNAFKSKRRAKR
jgi:hypothetical protein